MEVKVTEILDEKFNNFKYLLCDHIINEENKHFREIMNYEIDDILFFYEKNIRAYYETFGMDMIVNSFIIYLELDSNNQSLKDSIKKYFNFFRDVIGSINGEEETNKSTNQTIEEGQGKGDEQQPINEEVQYNQNDDLQQSK